MDNSGNEVNLVSGIIRSPSVWDFSSASVTDDRFYFSPPISSCLRLAEVRYKYYFLAVSVLMSKHCVMLSNCLVLNS